MKKRTLFFRKLQENGMQLVAMIVLAISLGGMLWILGTTISRGMPVLSWTFLTEPSKPFGIDSSGIANALLGTLLITTVATILTIPPGLAGGIWLAEFGGKTRIGQAIRFAANVMMGIPSIIIGLFVYAVMVIPSGHFSGLSGSVALGLIMLPIIMRTTEDMLVLVPHSIREASLSLGMTRWRATVGIVCRCAKNGLVTGILMSLARVAGETAPLLFTALWSNDWCGNFFKGPTPNLPVLITEYTTNSPYPAQHAAGWGSALVVMVLIFMLNIGVRFCFAGKEQSK